MKRSSLRLWVAACVIAASSLVTQAFAATRTWTGTVAARRRG